MEGENEESDEAEVEVNGEEDDEDEEPIEEGEGCLGEVLISLAFLDGRLECDVVVVFG